MNLQESIRRILREETKPGKYARALEIITNVIKKEDFVCDIEVKYYGAAGTYEVIVKIDKKEMETNFEKLSIWYAEKLIREYLSDLRKKVEKEIKDFLPVKVLVYIDQFSCNKKLNESEDNREKKIQKNLKTIRQLLDTINLKGLCEMWVEYNPEDGDYEIRSKTTIGHFDTDNMVQELRYIEDTLKSWGLKTYVFAPWPVENCEDEVEFLNESEEKKSRLLSNIEENGLYEVISSTGLHINEIEQKVGQLSREVLERFIKDVVKEHFQVIDDDGKTYIIYLEDYPFDVVPIGNSDYVDQLRVTNNKLFILVTIYEEDEYGDLEEQSYEIVSPKNLSYDNIYEIAGQLAYLMVKDQI